MLKQIENLKKSFAEDLSAVQTAGDLDPLRNKYLSRKGLVAELFNGLKDVPSQDRPQVGQALNELKKQLRSQLIQLSHDEKIISVIFCIPTVDFHFLGQAIQKRQDVGIVRVLGPINRYRHFQRIVVIGPPSFGGQGEVPHKLVSVRRNKGQSFLT